MGGAFVLVIGSTGDYYFMMIEFEWLRFDSLENDRTSRFHSFMV